MSLVATRLSLRHRTSVQRLVSVPDGGGGSTETWDPDYLTGVPCRAWTEVKRDAEGELAGKVTVIHDRRLVVPVGTDVTEEDRLGDITDKAGALVFAGPMRIEAVGRHRTHLELLVAEIT